MSINGVAPDSRQSGSYPETGLWEAFEFVETLPKQNCAPVRAHPKTWVQLGSICCRIRHKTEYYDTEQSQANQLDGFSFSSLQAGGTGSIPVTSTIFIGKIAGFLSSRVAMLPSCYLED